MVCCSRWNLVLKSLFRLWMPHQWYSLGIDGGDFEIHTVNGSKDVCGSLHHILPYLTRGMKPCSKKPLHCLWIPPNLINEAYLVSMEVILKSMLWMEVKMFVAPCTTHSLVSGMATGVHHDKKTGSLREQSGNTPENLPSIKTTCKKTRW